MLKRYSLLIPLLVVFLFSCSDNNEESIKKEELELLKTEVFSIHDQVLPDLLITLPASKDSLTAYIPKVSRTRADSLKKSFAKLDSVQLNMTKWMKQYDSKKIEEKGSLDERISYVRDQKEKLIKVKTQMAEGINTANNLVMISRMGLFKPKMNKNIPDKGLMNRARF